MAIYTVTYTPDGRVKKELSYQNEVFAMTMIPDKFGKTSDNKGFDLQVAARFPDDLTGKIIDAKVIDALGALTFADENGIEEILDKLTRYETEREETPWEK